MAETQRISNMYGEFSRFAQKIETNAFYTYFRDVVNRSPVTMSMFEKYVERRIDMAWLEAIESAIIPLDTIIRKPNSYIKREEDITPIAMARDIGPESVRHLSQHTNMIASVEGDTVTPNRILTIRKEESFDTYENRFIYTLIGNTTYFLDKRMKALMKDSKVADRFEYQLDGNCTIGGDRVNYHFSMNFDTPHEEVKDDDKLLNADVSLMTPLQRIERLRRIMYTFQGSAFYRNLTGSAPVRPPLVMTNVLKKNPNFIKAVALWNFINSYSEEGYSTNFIERYKTPTEDEKDELYTLLMLQYVTMKKQTGSQEGEIAELDQVNLSAPNIINRSVEQLSENFNLTLDEIRNIFEHEIRKKERKRDAEFAKARGIFERAITFEQENKKNREQKRRDRLVAELKRRLKMAQEEEKRLKAENEKKEQEKRRIEAEEAERLKKAEKIAAELRRMEEKAAEDAAAAAKAAEEAAAKINAVREAQAEEFEAEPETEETPIPEETEAAETETEAQAEPEIPVEDDAEEETIEPEPEETEEAPEATIELEPEEDFPVKQPEQPEQAAKQPEQPKNVVYIHTHKNRKNGSKNGKNTRSVYNDDALQRRLARAANKTRQKQANRATTKKRRIRAGINSSKKDDKE